MKLTGAEIFVECLKREGVKTIFGLPGGVVLKIFDVLHQQKDVEVILTRHEAGAGHMAEGYAKATGKPGVALVTSGPGMTNATRSEEHTSELQSRPHLGCRLLLGTY